MIVDVRWGCELANVAWRDERRRLTAACQTKWALMQDLHCSLGVWSRADTVVAGAHNDEDETHDDVVRLIVVKALVFKLDCRWE
jgi:hypothetical protein